jgi:hypothetical protein
LDKEGNFYAISFASRQLKDHEKNYSPILLEATTAVWGMDIFNNFNKYLRGKQFILYMDHKPLEKLGHLHNKMLNRLQSALLEQNFIMQYKKGSNMPADYLSQLPASEQSNNVAKVAGFDPFQSDLYELQMKDEMLQILQNGISTNKWPMNMSKTDCKNVPILAKRVFKDINKIVWVWLNDFNYPPTALYLPEKYRKEAM